MVQHKICFRCGEDKSLDDFYPHPQTADKHLGKCIVCTKADSIATRRASPEHYAEYDRARQQTPERRHKKARYLKTFRATHPGFVAYHNSLRRTRVRRAMPDWVDVATIKRIYVECPKTRVVDHIVPLVNKKVCGLHVPWNLQYLTSLRNSRKGNRFVVEAA